MIGVYQPGTSLLHRAPAAVKLLGLLAAVVGVLLLSTPPGVGLAAVGVVLVTLACRVPLRVLLRQLRPLLWIGVPLFGFQWLTSGPERGSVIVGQLVVTVALAALVTLTTRVTEMLETFERALAPFARIGVDPERVGLVLALTIRYVPLVAQRCAEIRDATRARGGRAGPGLVVPVLIRLIRQADRTGEALSARGVDH